MWWTILRVSGASDRTYAIASLINYLLDAESWLVCHPMIRRINLVMSLVLVLKGFFLLVFTDFSEKLKSLHSDDFGENRCQFM
ncbi:hypothetical protein [Nostoc sp.]|uniref:hypothetical protein n=1 Tax=Nostoc sp. TaxID=1180 RepID=UPI002FFD0A54